MRIEYQKNKLKKQMSSASDIKKAFGVRAKRVSTRLVEIEASTTLSNLMQIPAANCHPLTADRRGQWAVDISHNFRIIFVIDHNPIPLTENGSVATDLITNISITDVEDYH